MKPDLFLAILSMDSYNRGYTLGIAGLGTTYGVTKIGSATISEDKGDLAAQAAGFYAIAYEWNGQTVISYRGTDEDLWLDIQTGYTTGLGWPLSPQAGLAPGLQRQGAAPGELGFPTPLQLAIPRPRPTSRRALSSRKKTRSASLREGCHLVTRRASY